MSAQQAWFAQEDYRCRLEWGRRGARAAAQRGDVLVVVDALSFSTAAATAVQRGGRVYPCAAEEEAAAIAAQVGAEIAVRRQEVPARGRFSLSPPTFLALEPGTRVALASPNGATCVRSGRDAARLFVGAFVNARAVGAAVGNLLTDTEAACVTVLACGERWQEPSEDGDLRFALEDYLGAGAILAHIPPDFARSPEADVCEAAFLAARDDLADVLLACGSGVELIAKGYEGDVLHAAQLAVYDAVPVLEDGRRYLSALATRGVAEI